MIKLRIVENFKKMVKSVNNNECKSKLKFNFGLNTIVKNGPLKNCVYKWEKREKEPNQSRDLKIICMDGLSEHKTRNQVIRKSCGFGKSWKVEEVWVQKYLVTLLSY